MKILVVLPRFPYPLEKGDKLRAYHQIVELSKRHEVFLFALSHHPVDSHQLAALQPFCREICIGYIPRMAAYKNVLRNYLSTKSLQLGYWDSRSSRRACRDFVARVKPDVIFNQMVRTIPHIARLPYPKVMDFQDALSMNTERRMEKTKGFMRHILHFEFKMLRSTEYNAFKIFDALTIISPSDRDAIPHRQGRDIHILPNGVDFLYFNTRETSNSPNLQFDICFTGNMQYHPNIDASCYLVHEVMPLVWQRLPEARLVLAGATPKAAVRNLAGPRVTVTGTVSDIRPYYLQSRVFVAPMRIGSGLQNKLLEAMSMGIPCVTTPLANEALGAVNGQQLLLANDAQGLAEAIVKLLEDVTLSERLTEKASLFVRQHFSWESIGIQLEQILLDAINSYRHNH